MFIFFPDKQSITLASLIVEYVRNFSKQDIYHNFYMRICNYVAEDLHVIAINHQLADIVIKDFIEPVNFQIQK